MFIELTILQVSYNKKLDACEITGEYTKIINANLISSIDYGTIGDDGIYSKVCVVDDVLKVKETPDKIMKMIEGKDDESVSCKKLCEDILVWQPSGEHFSYYHYYDLIMDIVKKCIHKNNYTDLIDKYKYQKNR